MSLWTAIENLFRGPSSTAGPILFDDGRTRAAVAPRESYAAVADLLPRFELGKAKWPDFDVARYDADAYRKRALVTNSLRLISHAVGRAKVKVYDEANDDQEIPDHRMRRLMRQPNPQMGEARFWGTVALRAGIGGFCVAEKERDGFGDVIALKPLKSPWLKAVARGGGRYDWEYRIPGVTPVSRLAAEDVVKFTFLDTPDGSPYGLPPLSTVVQDVAILAKLTEFVGNLLDRGGVPMWMLLQDEDAATMDDEELKAWEERFARHRGGFERRDRPWLAEGIRDAKKLSYDVEELAMEALRDVHEAAICQAFGINPRKAGAIIGLKHSTENATAAVEDGEFYRDTISPLWSRFDDDLTTGLLPDFEPQDSSVSLEFDTSDVEALQEDKNEKARAIIVPGFTGGLLSNHMALRQLGMQIPDGLPEYYLRGISVEAIPADDPLQLSTTTTTTTPPPVVPPPQLGSVRVLEIPMGHLSGLNGVAYSPRGTYAPTERLAKRKAIGAANRKLIKSVADAREPSVRRFLSAQAERIAAAVKAPLGVALARSNGHVRETYSVAEIDWARENELLSEVLKSLHLLAGSTAFDAASEQVGVAVNFDLANPKVRAVLDRLAGKVVDITQTTRDLIAEILTAGEEAGKGVTEIAKDIVQSTGFSTARASTIARSESQVSYGLANHLAYRESGVVDRVQLFDNPNHTTDPGTDGLTCAEREGLIVPLDDADKHILAEHPNGSLSSAPVLIGEE